MSIRISDLQARFESGTSRIPIRSFDAKAEYVYTMLDLIGSNGEASEKSKHTK
jgi:hypothetical protein